MNLSGLLGTSKDLGVRFNVVGLLPTAVLGLFVLALVVSGAPGDAPDVDKVLDEAENLSVWEGTLIFLGLLVLALVTQPLQLSLVRVLEGYWGDSGLGRALAWPGRRYHRLRRERLARRQTVRPGDEPATPEAIAAAGARLRRFYPPERGILPTRLGNVLRAAEHRAGSRYGLEATVAWPRLYPLLPAPLLAVVDDLRDQLDLAARFCVVFLVGAGVSLGFLAGYGWWLLVPAGALVLAWLSYRATVAAALAYGEGLQAAFDLHRFDLIGALHLPLPANLDAEKTENARLSAFLLRGEPVNFVYDHGDEDAPAPAAADAEEAEAAARNGFFGRVLGRLRR